MSELVEGFDEPEPVTAPVNVSVLMTIPQVRDALSAMPPELQPLVLAMVRAADDNGYLRGIARLTRLGPFEHHPASDRPVQGAR